MRNIPRFFVEHPHISWVLPDTCGRLGLVRLHGACRSEKIPTFRCGSRWPHVPGLAPLRSRLSSLSPAPSRIRSLRTRRFIQRQLQIMEFARSLLPGVAYVYVQLAEGTDIRKQFSDINLKLNDTEQPAAARRRSDLLPERFWGHGRTHADGGESQGGPG